MNPSPSFRYQQQQQQWDTRTEMLASAIMLLSISEGQASHVGYHAAQRPISPSNSGCETHGMGSMASRQSIKTDLASLGAGNAAASATSNNSFYHQQSSSVSESSLSSSSSSDDWGFYAFD